VGVSGVPLTKTGPRVARSGIKARVTELEQDHQGTLEERRALAHALNGLGILRKERIDG